LGASGTFYFAGQNFNKVGGTFNGTFTVNFTQIAWSNPTLPRKTIKQFYHDLGTVFIVFDDGELYAWGNNNLHQIDSTNTTGYSNVTRIDIGEPVAQISSLSSENFDFNTFLLTYSITITALSTNGYVYSWGSTDLGRDDMLGKSVPQKISNDQYKMLPKKSFINNITTNTPTPTTTLSATTDAPTSSAVPTTTLPPVTTIVATSTDTPTPTTLSPESNTPTPTTVSTTTTSSPVTTGAATVTTSVVTSTTSPTTSSATPTSGSVITTTTLSPVTTEAVTSTASVTTSAVTSTSGSVTTTSSPVVTSTTAVTSTAIPTTSATPTTTLSTASCYDQVGSSACNGNGVCVTHNNCQCNIGILGKQCDIVLQTTSSTFVAFDTTSNSSSIINIDAANQIPGATGTANYTFSSEGLLLSTTYGQSETGKKGVCLKPSLVIANMQTFVIFNIPVTQPSGTAVEVWLMDATKQYTIRASIKQTNNGQVFEIRSKSSFDSTNTNLQTGVDYLIVLSVDQSGSFVTTQILTIVSCIVIILIDLANGCY
jgi:hypothetical protein